MKKLTFILMLMGVPFYNIGPVLAQEHEPTANVDVPTVEQNQQDKQEAADLNEISQESKNTQLDTGAQADAVDGEGDVTTNTESNAISQES